MTDTLKERLDAFNAAILVEKPPYVCSPTVTAAEYVFLKAVGKAYRSGNLVTKEDLEAAVAKAVADEREQAIDAVLRHAPRFGPVGPETSEEFGEDTGFRVAVQMLRVRKEGK